MSTADAEALREQLRRDGRLSDPAARLAPLAGGVSSDIYLVEDGPDRFVVKRALPRLRVRDEWRADVRRNDVERAYLEAVGRLAPGSVPRVLFAHPAAGYFAMEYLGAGYANWKRQLLDGVFAVATARTAGRWLGAIHRQTAGDAALRARFDTTANFHQLRTAPYLLTTGARHPELREFFESEARRLKATRECLVHGDFSPKNLLVGADGRLVVLDCEVAWYGDPAFDVAFLLNHLLLKRLYHAPRGGALRELAAAFWQSYLGERTGLPADWETRVTRLLLLLLLARVDGKSPVEYLDAARADLVRHFVSGSLPAGAWRLAALVDAWFQLTARPDLPARPRGAVA
jgi:aminoglycoside phosphotransferase (APT) family kinase protein